MKCENDDHDLYPHYGLAPHKHVGITSDPMSFIGSTKFDDKSEWPDNFVEDKQEPGMGTYYCPWCWKGKK